MSGTVAGGKNAAITNRSKYGMDFYKKIGHKGGISGDPTTKGFANPEHRKKAAAAGARGGSASRRPSRLEATRTGARASGRPAEEVRLHNLREGIDDARNRPQGARGLLSLLRVSR